MHRALFITKCENWPERSNDHCEPCLQRRSREESNMASGLEEEMQIESESSVDTCELLPRNCPITYGRYDSLVAFSRRGRVTWNSGKCWLSRQTRWNWSGTRTLYFLTGLLNSTFLFFLRLPKYDWLFICSVSRVSTCKTNCSRKKPARSAGCPCRNAVNALYVADIKIYRGKSSSVRMAETRPQKIFTRSSVFCLLDVCEQSIIRGSKKLFIELFFNRRGSLDYVRNVAKKFDEPEPDYPLSNSKNISSRRLMF